MAGNQKWCILENLSMCHTETQCFNVAHLITHPCEVLCWTDFSPCHRNNNEKIEIRGSDFSASNLHVHVFYLQAFSSSASAFHFYFLSPLSQLTLFCPLLLPTFCFNFALVYIRDTDLKKKKKKRNLLTTCPVLLISVPQPRTKS